MVWFLAKTSTRVVISMNRKAACTAPARKRASRLALARLAMQAGKLIERIQRQTGGMR